MDIYVGHGGLVSVSFTRPKKGFRACPGDLLPGMLIRREILIDFSCHYIHLIGDKTFEKHIGIIFQGSEWMFA